ARSKMANPLSLPQPDLRPSGVIGGGAAAPNPLEQFLPAFLAARQQKSSESAQARTHEIALAHLKLLQEQQKTEQAKADAVGGATQQYYKTIAPFAEVQA